MGRKAVVRSLTADLRLPLPLGKILNEAMIGNQTPFLLSTPAHNEPETCRAQADTRRGKPEATGGHDCWLQQEDRQVQPCHPAAWTVLGEVHHTLTIGPDNHTPERVTYRHEPHIFTKPYTLLLVAAASVITKHWIQCKLSLNAPWVHGKIFSLFKQLDSSKWIGTEVFWENTEGKVRAIRTSSEEPVPL